MARGRLLHRRVSTNEQLARVSLKADLLYTKAVAHLDREGRITGNAARLKAQVVPLRNEITAEEIPGLVRELEGSCGHEGDPLVVAYEVGGIKALWFPGFRRLQKINAEREAVSEFPAPPDLLRTNSGPTPAISVSVKVKGEADGPTPESDRSNWPAEVSGAFSKSCGPCSPGEAGAAISPQMGQFTSDEVIRAAGCFVKESTDKPQFKNVRTFAKQLPQWVKRSAPVPLLDESGNISPEFRAAMGVKS